MPILLLLLFFTASIVAQCPNQAPACRSAFDDCIVSRPSDCNCYGTWRTCVLNAGCQEGSGEFSAFRTACLSSLCSRDICAFTVVAATVETEVAVATSETIVTSAAVETSTFVETSEIVLTSAAVETSAAAVTTPVAPTVAAVCDTLGVANCRTVFETCTQQAGTGGATGTASPTCRCFQNWGICLTNLSCPADGEQFGFFFGQCDANTQCIPVCSVFLPAGACAISDRVPCDQAFVSCSSRFQNVIAASEEKNRTLICPCYSTWGSCLIQAGCGQDIHYQTYQASCRNALVCNNVCPLPGQEVPGSVATLGALTALLWAALAFAF